MLEKGTGENEYASLLECEINEKEDYVTFKFLTESTEPIYPKDYEFQQSDQDSNFKLLLLTQARHMRFILEY